MVDLRIARPCTADWTAMEPGIHGRHCAACDTTVVDVAAMAPDRADAFLRVELPQRLRSGEHICVRAPATRDGRLIGSTRRRLLTNGLALILAFGVTGCQPAPDQAFEQPTATPVMMGGLKAPEPVVDQPPPDAPPPATTMGEVELPTDAYPMMMGRMAPVAAPTPTNGTRADPR